MLAGAIGSLLAQGLEPFAAARLGVYLHGAGGRRRPRAVRRCRPARVGPARRARPRPQAARGRRRAAPGAQAPGLRGARPATGRRDATATGRRPTGRPGRTRLSRAPRPAWPRGADRGRGWRPPACRRCRGPPGSRSTSTRSRATWRSLRELRRARRRRSARSSRPTPTATGRSRSPARSRRPAPTGSASRPSTRRSRCATAGIAAPILVLYPIPAAWAAEAARRGIAVTAGDPDLLGRDARRPAAGDAPGRAPLAVELEVETGLGAAASHADGARRGRRGDRARAGPSARRPLDPPPGARGRGRDGRASWHGSRPRRRRLRGGRDPPAGPPRRGERGPR